MARNALFVAHAAGASVAGIANLTLKLGCSSLFTSCTLATCAIGARGPCRACFAYFFVRRSLLTSATSYACFSVRALLALSTGFTCSPPSVWLLARNTLFIAHTTGASIAGIANITLQ
jgi:hypothetical protein